MDFLSVLDKGWPLAGAVLAGAMAFASLSSDVRDLKTNQEVVTLDHDKVISLVQGQADMKETLVSMQSQLNRIEKQTK